MPTSNKTPNLNLNSWVGTDKPMRSDFVEDNTILDTIVGAHLNNEVMHLTQDDRGRLEAPYYFNSYTGSGAATRVFTFDFTPKLVLVAAWQRAFSEYGAGGSHTIVNAALATASYCSAGVILSGNKLTVKQTTGAAADGLYHNLNETDSYYFYVVFK